MRDYRSPLTGATADLRLDMNESTTGCSPRVLAKIRDIDRRTLALYPPREPGEELIAKFLGLSPSEVLLTNGADEGLDLVSRAYLDDGDEIIIVVPTFAMYEVFARVEKATIVRVSCGKDWEFPAEQVLNSMTARTRVIVICNPNNPTGRAVERSVILQITKAAPDAAVLLDEAYYDFYGQTVIDLIGKLPNLFIARTFSKAYGLAGLRLGVMAGPEKQIAILRKIASPFNVNALALECLGEALADRQFVADYVAQVRSSREWLKQQLEALGVKCWPSQGNFLFCNFGATKAEVLQAMTHRGIALRERPDCEGCVRISIGTQQEVERLVTELKRVLVNTPVVEQVHRP